MEKLIFTLIASLSGYLIAGGIGAVVCTLACMWGYDYLSS